MLSVGLVKPVFSSISNDCKNVLVSNDCEIFANTSDIAFLVVV